MKNTNIWIINHYAILNNGRHASLARFFQEKGYKTSIILSSYSHEKGEYLYDEKVKVIEGDNGVDYVYIHSKPSYLGNGLGRIINMISFCLIASNKYKYIKERIGTPNYIIASSVHPFVWEIGYKIAKWTNAKFIAEIRDIWPLSLVEVTHISKMHPFVKLLEIVERRAYKRADAIVSTMPFAYKHICDGFGVKREKVHWMPNGIDVKEYEKDLKDDVTIPIEIESFINNNWCCVYAGSLVSSECLPLMLEAFSLLKNEDVYFAIIGAGHDEEMLKKMRDDFGLEKVKFFPAVQKTLVAKILEKANCCIGAVHNIPLYRFGLSLNKMNDYLLSGKPVIFACNYDNVVKDAGQFAIPSESAEILAETIRKIKTLGKNELDVLAHNSKKLIKETYDYEVIADNYIRMLDSL